MVLWWPPADYSQWIYGGAFAFGDASLYNGSTFVQRSVELGEPVIYVSFNYRVNAFGWLGGKEALAGGAANVGLYDREYHFDDRDPSWVLTFNYFNLSADADGPGIFQKSSSWPGSRPTSPSSAAIQVGLLCEYLLCGPPSRRRSLISITHAIQLGAQCGRHLYYRPPRHDPHQPSIQGCHLSGSLQSQNQFRCH